MEQLGNWRVVADEPNESAGGPANGDSGAKSGPSVPAWQLAVGLGALVVAVVGAAIWLTVPQPSVSLEGLSAGDVQAVGSPGNAPSAGASPAAIGQAKLVVDVEGAVGRPGLATLPSGSRVGDAIAAAGGYSSQVDIAAAAALLNLAEPLKDGDKVHVPARGETSTSSSGGSSPGQSAGDGLIDINHASADELDTLPGVGPVTAGKIIAARAEAPFAAPDELVSRNVMSQSTYDKLSSLITVAP